MRVKTAILIAALLAALVLPAAAASEVTMAGWARYVFTQPFGTSAIAHAVYGRLYGTFKVDDFTTFYLRIQNEERTVIASATATPVTFDNMYLARAYVASNVAKFFKLDAMGLGAMLYMGKWWHGDAGYSNITYNSIEDIGVTGLGDIWAVGGDLSFKIGEKKDNTLATLELAIAPKNTNDFYVGLFTSQSASFGKISAEVCYDGNLQTEIAKGIFLVDGAYEKSFGDLAVKVGGGMNYNLASEAMQVNAAGKFGYGKFGDLGVGLQLMKTTAATTPYVFGQLQVTVIPNIALLASTRLNFGTGADMLDMLDCAARFDVGPNNDVYVGYIKSASKSNWATLACASGGLYFKYELTY